MPNQNNVINLMDQLHNQQWSTRVDLGTDDDPEQAARASEIAESTGAEAGAVYDNLDDNERALKQQLSHQIVKGDPFLQNYINSHPLAAKVSNDDWGNLSTAGESYRKVATAAQRPWWEVGSAGVARGIQSGGGTLIAGLGRMLDSPNLSRIGKQLLDSVDTSVPLSEEDQNRISAQLGSGIGQLLSLLPTAAAGGVPGAALTMGVQTGETEAEKAEKAGRPEEAANVFTGGFALGTGLGMIPLGYLEKIGAGAGGQGLVNYASRALQEAVKSGLVFGATGELQAAAMGVLERETFDPNAKYSPDITRMISNTLLGTFLGGSFGLVKPFVDSGQPIPPGVHPFTDKILIEKTKVDNEALDQAVKDATKTNTRERSPDFMAKYFKLQPDASIALDGAEVLKLYGDKPPSPDDGILGWLPGIQQKLTAAARDGGDIHVPLADYLARIEPEVDKELHDFRRVDPNGLTLDDAKNLASGAAPGEQEEVQDLPLAGALKHSPVPALDAVRAQTGMDKILPQPKPYESHLAGDEPGPGILPKDFDPNARESKHVEAHAGGYGYNVIKEYKGRDLLKNIDSSLFKDRPSQAMFEFFGHQISKIAGDYPVQILKDQDHDDLHMALGGFGGSNAFHWRGDPDKGQRGIVAINESTASGRNGRQYAAHAIIHELAHAASVKYMQDDPELGKAVVDLRDETLKWVRLNKPELLDHPGISYALGERGNTGSRFDRPGYEYVAQAYSEPDFQDLLAEVPISKDLADRIGKPAAKSMWEAARHIVKKAFEALLGRTMPTSALDAMFSLGQRFEHAHTQDPSLAATEPFKEEPIPTPEERQLFRDQKTLGYSKKHWERIRAKIAEQKEADNEWHKEQVEKRERERLTEENKARTEEMRPEAEQRINQRSDIAADRFFRMGIAPDGSKVTRVRLDQSKIPPDLRKLMDPEHYGSGRKFGDRGVVNPDDVAGMFGYRSGDAMLHDLAGLHQERQAAGLTPSAHIGSLQDIELERMMKAKYGTFDEQLLEAVKDHILNDGQFDLLHEDTLRLATKYGMTDVPWTKSDIKLMARGDLKDGMRVGELKSTRLADQTGRIGRKIEDAENRGDAVEVMKLAQAREISFYKTIEARKFEKLQSQAEKIMKRHRKIELTNFKTEESAGYHHAIRVLMGQLGEPTGKRAAAESANELTERGFKDVGDFIDKKQTDGWPIAAGDWIKQGMKDEKGVPYSDLDKLTVGEGEAFYNAIKSLDKNGKDTFTFNREQQVFQLEPFKNAILDELERFSIKDRDAAPPKGWVGKAESLFKHYLSASINMERMLNRADGDNPRGPFNQLVVRTFSSAANNKEVLARKYGKMLKDLGEPPVDLGKSVELPFKVPSTGHDFVHATNKEKLAIALNMGSVENWTKFTNGWKVDPAVLETWMDQHMSKEEWQWVQGIWKIFSSMKVELDREYRRTTGTAPGTKEFRTIQTRFGPIDGGYYQLLHDEQEIGKGTRTATVTTDDGKNFFQESIPNPHAKEVTKAEYPVSMDLDRLPNTIQQIIHDIAFREPLHEIQKVLKDKQIRQAIRNRMGLEYEQQIQPWLEWVAHAGDSNNAATLRAQQVSDFWRQNIISYLVGFNISTVAKHGPTALVNSARQVGVGPLMKSYATLFNSSPNISDNMWQFAMKNSEELQRRERYWQETFGGVYKDFTKSTLREHIIAWGAKPVAFSDKLSAVPMWIAAYQNARAAGMDHGEATFEGDRAVRFAHGSTATTNLPMIARGKGIHAWMTSLYGFFGTMMQNRMELAWKLNDAYNLGMHGEIGKAAKLMPLVAADAFAYIVWPTVVEEYVTGLWSDDRRGWGQRIAWATAGGLASSYIYARDLVHGLEYGLDTSGGMLGSAIKPFADAVNDTGKVLQGKWPKDGAGKFIKDAIAVTAYTHGVPKELGNLAQYGWDTLIANREHPYTGVMKNWHQFGDLGLGLTRGTQKYTVRR